MGMPIEVNLKDAKQVALARLQDYVVEAVVEVEQNIVMHGGTAIWRCYGGNRFSEDVDIYASNLQIKKLHNHLTWSLSKRGIKMDYPSEPGGTIVISDNIVNTKLEVMVPPNGLKSEQKEYERINGSKFFISTLSIGDFIREKASTYQKRRYIRDFYDLYHLVSIEKPDPRTRKIIMNFLNGMEPPIDEGKLKDLVYTGVAPSFKTMVDYIGRRME
jgi:predicted nucleotidyltransferase component of viral defense system